MSNDPLLTRIKLDENNQWYTEEFIAGSMVTYLKKNGYKIHKENPGKEADRNDKIITASRYFSKETIGIKGLQNNNGRASLLKAVEKEAASSQAKSWLSETLFNSLINFGKYYSDDNSELSMALPNVDKYMAIIERVQEYFFANKLSLKVYLINEQGEVEVSNLNVKHA